MRRPGIDRLALLCTLHADGPRTLRRLREVGCYSLDVLGEMETDRIGSLLDLPPAAARRLSREANRLQDRLAPDLEREEVTFPPAAGQRVGGLGNTEFALPEDPGSDPVSRLDMRDRELLDRVVHNWRPVEYVERPEPAVEEAPEEEQQEAAHNERNTVLHAAPAAPTESDQPPSLQPGDVDGLDGETCERLHRAGIHTLDDLVNSSVDDLMAGAGLPFTRARTLQFRAGKRRVVALNSPADASPFVPAEAPLSHDARATADLEGDCEDDFAGRDDGPGYELRPLLPEDDSGAAGPFA